jgi:hypothetical protein
MNYFPAPNLSGAARNGIASAQSDHAPHLKKVFFYEP